MRKRKGKRLKPKDENREIEERGIEQIRTVYKGILCWGPIDRGISKCVWLVGL
jgi:hypothetical protein